MALPITIQSLSKNEENIDFPQISQDLWEEKYKWNGEKSPTETTNRMCDGVYKFDTEHKQNGINIIESREFCPGGRIIAGAGTDKNVTLKNCYVSDNIEDSLDDIMNVLKEGARTQQMGGGIGYSFSTIRPRGALVKRTQSISTGVLPFMDMFNAMCQTIRSSGSRRGAQMGVLADNHPDILEFIAAKHEPGRLTNFNMSVLVSDKLMESVKNNQYWFLKFKKPCHDYIYTGADGDYLYASLKASELWDTIIRSTYEYAEPGVLFVDTANKMNNLWWCEKLTTVNPCVTGDTLILTSEGYLPIEETIGKKIHVWNGDVWSSVKPFSTGVNPILKVNLSNGESIKCTPSHTFILNTGVRVIAEDLKIGDKLEKFIMPIIEQGTKYEINAYSQGFYSGDGTAGYEKSFLYNTKYNCQDRLIGWFSNEYVNRKQWYHGPMFDKNWVPVNGTLEYKLHWLAGLLDSDGTVTRDTNGNGLQISSINKDFLLRVRLLLTTLGTEPKVVNGAPERDTNIKGKFYHCQPGYRLLIGNKDTYNLKELGLETNRLEIHTNPPQRSAQRFVTVTSVEDLEIEEETFCFTDEISNRGTFNGVVTGQCAEQWLPANDSCNLGAINLAQLVENPFYVSSKIKFSRLREVIHHAVRFLDNIIDITNYPTVKQSFQSSRTRRLGLGVMGLGTMLQMLGIKYGSNQALETTESIMKFIRDESYWASIMLAKERGSFPIFDKRYLEGNFIQTLTGELKDAILKHGIRNSLLTTIAPTGNTSIYYGNVSSGLEPSFALEYTRKVLQQNGSKKEYKVFDFGYGLFKRLHPYSNLPNSFITALELTVDDHLNMQAACQKYVDNSISKTINCPKDITYNDFKHVYERAYDLGLKGCTTYKPSDVRGSVLEVAPSCPSGVCSL